MTGDTNPTTPAAVEWAAAEREVLADVAVRPELRAELAFEPLADDERFCDVCKAGVGSSEHLSKPCGEDDR